MPPRLLITVLVACVFCLASFHARSQADQQLRAQSHLDAARALVKPTPPYSAALKYAELAGLEHLAGRKKQAREAGYMLLGLMKEDTTTDKDLYLHLLAQARLEMEQTEAAISALELVAKPTMTTQNLQLEATQQLTRRFGLQRGIAYARQVFPDTMKRADVYQRLCYTLAVNGEADAAMDFITVTFDLLAIFKKLDAYRFAAYGLYRSGDQEGAASILEDALRRAISYRIVSTRVSMLAELAASFDEIGKRTRGLEVLALAEAAVGEIKSDDPGRDGMSEDIAEAYAILNQRDKALRWIAKTKLKRGSTTFYQNLINADLRSGQIARARELNEQSRTYFDKRFDVRVAMAKLERGDVPAATTDLARLALDRFAPSDWHREAGAAFARKGQHAAIATLLAKIKDPAAQFSFHIGAAEGYLGE